MKKEHCIVGTRVTETVSAKLEKFLPKSEYGDDTRRGFIDALSVHDDKVYVTWDDNSWSKQDAHKLRTISGLMLEEEANGILFKLEYEYAQIAERVKGKMIEAGQLLKEAEQIAQKGLNKRISEMGEAIYPLTHAMDECGWSTSSLFC